MAAAGPTLPPSSAVGTAATTAAAVAAAAAAAAASSAAAAGSGLAVGAGAAAAAPTFVDGRSRRGRLEGPIRFRVGGVFRKNTIYDVMKHRGWKETESDDDWDMHWAEREWVYEVFDTMHLQPWQRINHFRNGRELCRKDRLISNMKRVRRQLERDGKPEEAMRYDFIPQSYILPGDYALFVEEFKRYPGTVWIMKPTGRAQGKGIFLFNKLSQISQWKSEYRWKPENPGVEAYVVQRYVANPYLIGGKKFDMRVYAMVTSYAPLKVYLHRSAFARFSASRYSLAANDIVNNFVHLTNVAVQKENAEYNADTGGKWDLRNLKLYLMARHGREAADRAVTGLQEIIILSLLGVQKVMINDKHCFELYGYDLLLDDTLRPWLLECNASPSLTANTREDYDLKFKLLNDVLDIVDLEGRLAGDERTIGGFDLIWDDGAVTPPVESVYHTLLGADFDRRLNVFRGPRPRVTAAAAGAAVVAAVGFAAGSSSSSSSSAAAAAAAASASSSSSSSAAAAAATPTAAASASAGARARLGPPGV